MFCPILLWRGCMFKVAPSWSALVSLWSSSLRLSLERKSRVQVDRCSSGQHMDSLSLLDGDCPADQSPARLVGCCQAGCVMSVTWHLHIGSEEIHITYLNINNEHKWQDAYLLTWSGWPLACSSVLSTARVLLRQESMQPASVLSLSHFLFNLFV